MTGHPSRGLDSAKMLSVNAHVLESAGMDVIMGEPVI